eukprot:165072-Amphidinium_carterae.1
MEVMQAMFIQTADVNPKGRIDMLLNQLTKLVETKGDTGIDPDEIEHIHGIFLDAVEDDRLDFRCCIRRSLHATSTRTRYIAPKRRSCHRALVKVPEVCNNGVQTEKDVICTVLNRAHVILRFQEEWQNCTEFGTNCTALHQQCHAIQKQWEEQRCSWKTTI